jgi:hypothetical protein
MSDDAQIALCEPKVCSRLPCMLLMNTMHTARVLECCFESVELLVAVEHLQLIMR